MPTSLTKRFKPAGLISGLLLLAGCAAQQVAAVPVGPIPPGQARIWFYRVYDPSLSRNLANVDLNGARAVSVSPSGPPLSVDVAPGHYHIAPESVGAAVNQAKDIDLAAGEEAYIKILDDPTWLSSGDLTAFQRDTFYAWLMPARVARAEMRMPM